MIRRVRQLVTLIRNLWFLRGELFAIALRRRRGPRTVELRCLRCKRPLTKPCRGGRNRPHVIRYPEGFGSPKLAGKIFFVEQTHGNTPARVWEKPS